MRDHTRFAVQRSSAEIIGRQKAPGRIHQAYNQRMRLPFPCRKLFLSPSAKVPSKLMPGGADAPLRAKVIAGTPLSACCLGRGADLDSSRGSPFRVDLSPRPPFCGRGGDFNERTHSRSASIGEAEVGSVVNARKYRAGNPVDHRHCRNADCRTPLLVATAVSAMRFSPTERSETIREVND